MRISTVLPREVNRVDLIIVRTLGADTIKYRKYFYFFNPNVDFTNLKAGTYINIPTLQEMRTVRSTRLFFMNGVSK